MASKFLKMVGLKSAAALDYNKNDRHTKIYSDFCNSVGVSA